jgi:hypothetical protein
MNLNASTALENEKFAVPCIKSSAGIPRPPRA